MFNMAPILQIKEVRELAQTGVIQQETYNKMARELVHQSFPYLRPAIMPKPTTVELYEDELDLWNKTYGENE